MCLLYCCEEQTKLWYWKCQIWISSRVSSKRISKNKSYICMRFFLIPASDGTWQSILWASFALLEHVFEWINVSSTICICKQHEITLRVQTALLLNWNLVSYVFNCRSFALILQKNDASDPDNLVHSVLLSVTLYEFSSFILWAIANYYNLHLFHHLLLFNLLLEILHQDVVSLGMHFWTIMILLATFLSS